MPLTYVVNVGDIFELSEEFSIAELYFLEYENTIQQPSLLSGGNIMNYQYDVQFHSDYDLNQPESYSDAQGLQVPLYESINNDIGNFYLFIDRIWERLNNRDGDFRWAILSEPFNLSGIYYEVSIIVNDSEFSKLLLDQPTWDNNNSARISFYDPALEFNLNEQPSIIIELGTEDSYNNGYTWSDPGFTKQPENSVTISYTFNNQSIANIPNKQPRIGQPSILGVYTINYLNDNSEELTRTVKYQDTVGPAISGVQPQILNIFDDLPDFNTGVSIFDYFDGVSVNVTISYKLNNQPVANINKNTVDNYTLDYSATDSNNNTSTIQKTVFIQDNNSTPTITLIDGDNIKVEFGIQFTEPGYSVDDNYLSSSEITVTKQIYHDSDLNTELSGGDSAISDLGNYIIKYTVSDGTNTIIKNRYVSVVSELTTPFDIEMISTYDNNLNNFVFSNNLQYPDIVKILFILLTKTLNSDKPYIIKNVRRKIILNAILNCDITNDLVYVGLDDKKTAKVLYDNSEQPELRTQRVKYDFTGVMFVFLFTIILT